MKGLLKMIAACTVLTGTAHAHCSQTKDRPKAASLVPIGAEN